MKKQLTSNPNADYKDFKLSKIKNSIKISYGSAHQINNKPDKIPNKNRPQRVPILVSSPYESDTFRAIENRATLEKAPY